ncbi:hypothetical protein LC608_28225 [Nostoc sp. XA010]|nr:hypothetical protein [Nostoc sp. XA010]MCC5660792.1 hypothetical protein [Nostoc sp. XA010]
MNLPLQVQEPFGSRDDVTNVQQTRLSVEEAVLNCRDKWICQKWLYQ